MTEEEQLRHRLQSVDLQIDIQVTPDNKTFKIQVPDEIDSKHKIQAFLEDMKLRLIDDAVASGLQREDVDRFLDTEIVSTFDLDNLKKLLR